MRYSAAQEYSIVLHQSCIDDLNALKVIDPLGYARVLTFLQEAKHNQHTLESLSIHGYVEYEKIEFDIGAWQAAAKQKLNLWRLKFIGIDTELQHYRLIYAFHPIQHRYYVLGLVHRSFNYDLGHETSQRILAIYTKVGIPEY